MGSDVASCACRYWWQDESGHRHETQQHEGGEQGDPLMPLLFSFAIHNALEEAKREMVDGEELFAFLDDICILCSPGRTRFLYNVIREKVEHGMNSVAHGKDTLLEQCWSVSSWNWRPGSRRVEPQRSEGVGDPSGLRGVCPRNQRLEVGGRAETLGRHPLDPRPSMWLAGSLAVCRSQVPPFPPNHASKRISGLCTNT